MWMFVLVMMVLTRTRSEDDSRVLATQSTAEGSASTRISCPNRRRKINATNTRAMEQPADTEQSVDPPKRRGPNLNLSVNRPLQDLPDGSKIPLIMDKHTISFVGTSATDFATECGIIMRNFCPMNYHTWESVPEDAKTLMENSSCCGQTPFLWKKTKKYSDKMEANRAKQVTVSRGGSRSIANHTFQMENIIEHKHAALDELNSKGTTITTTIELQLEKEAIKSVCGRKKTIQSAWEVGVGPVLRKKDSWMKSVAESSQGDSSENKSLRNKVIAFEAKQKRDKKYERMFEFIGTKFPDFESTIPIDASDEADSDNII